jgi:hypothetical protein
VAGALPVAVGHAHEHAGVDQPREPVGEDVVGDPELGAEVLEARDPHGRIAEDQQRPPIAEDIDGAAHRAWPVTSCA